MPRYTNACVCIFSKTNYSDISKTTEVANQIIYRFEEDIIVNLLAKNLTLIKRKEE